MNFIEKIKNILKGDTYSKWRKAVLTALLGLGGIVALTATDMDDKILDVLIQIVESAPAVEAPAEPVTSEE